MRSTFSAHSDELAESSQVPASSGPSSSLNSAMQALCLVARLHHVAAQWSGELILITSRASLAGALAKFDFSWVIPSNVRHRKRLGEVPLVPLFLQLFALISPLFFQVVMDKVLIQI